MEQQNGLQIGKQLAGGQQGAPGLFPDDDMSMGNGPPLDAYRRKPKVAKSDAAAEKPAASSEKLSAEALLKKLAAEQ